MHCDSAYIAIFNNLSTKECFFVCFVCWIEIFQTKMPLDALLAYNWEALDEQGCTVLVPYCFDIWWRSYSILNNFFIEN